ncbi:MAG: YgcG family protein, partial [Mesorhizobium sp.]
MSLALRRAPLCPAGQRGARRKASLAILFVALSLLFLPLATLAAELPALTGRVVDNAGIIDAATEAALTRKLADFEAKSSDQIVVATLPSLDGEEIEPFANRLFRAWKLGQTGEDNGVLLLVAKDDRKMRIEVGYGLEGTLTDLHTRLIIENDMVPAFRADDFSGGIMKAVDDMVMVLEGNSEELEARGTRNQQPPFNTDDLFFAIFISIWAIIFFGSIAASILPPIFGRKLGPGRYR